MEVDLCNLRYFMPEPDPRGGEGLAQDVQEESDEDSDEDPGDHSGDYSGDYSDDYSASGHYSDDPVDYSDGD